MERDSSMKTENKAGYYNKNKIKRKEEKRETQRERGKTRGKKE